MIDLNIIFDEIKKNAIKFDLKSKSKEELPIGISKFGGKPDVPKDFKWFYYEGEDYNGETLNRPLSFLAQINCEEVKKYDEDDLLPKKGILYFFYELSTMTWGFDPNDKGSAKVFYFDGNITDLIRADYPDDMQDDFKLPEIQPSFSSKYDLPYYEEFNEIYDYEDWDEYDEIRVSKGYEEEEVINKLLGYANVIQNGMLLECEKVTNEIYCGNEIDIDSEKLKQMEKNCSQWQLLFQLDTVIMDDFELMFGDCGRIYFYIKKDDLKNCKFDDCWLILQCC
ncbi:YwqG family protein [Clostridium sp. HMP27]|uniref:YwqG family protein n=1 Tax=Clostridium sp. HMP27 TaxID=1487921 RepID=UPI00052B991A|nr:YwqG family protein [Clostridium sp. HMP27]KGK81150.1 hypothetical protein DP68_18555 [Clostridium sp. HMP27]